MLIGNGLLVQRLITVGLFRLFRCIYTCVQHLFWQLNGTARQVLEARQPENYDRCAQVFDVLLCHKFCPLQNVTEKDFLCTHSGFVSPQYVIDNDHVTLMTFDDEYAIFSEAEKPGDHIWRNSFSSFIRIAQLEHTWRMIRVPIDAFHRMADTIGDPKKQLIFVYHISRCGSTLLKQVMENTERVVAISEPMSTNLLGIRLGKEGDTPGLRRLARDLIRWECRPYPTIEPPPLAYLIKITAPCEARLAFFKTLFPSSKALLMYRDPIASAKSTYRLSYVLPSLRLAYILGRLSASVMEELGNNMGVNGKDFRQRITDDLIFGVLLYAVSLRTYLDYRRDHEEYKADVRALRYEDLVGRPMEACTALMEFSGLPPELAKLAVRGLEKDSQRNSPLAKTVIGGIDEPALTPSVKDSLDALLRRFGLPGVETEVIADGSLLATECTEIHVCDIARNN